MMQGFFLLHTVWLLPDPSLHRKGKRDRSLYLFGRLTDHIGVNRSRIITECRKGKRANNSPIQRISLLNGRAWGLRRAMLQRICVWLVGISFVNFFVFGWFSWKLGFKNFKHENFKNARINRTRIQTLETKSGEFVNIHLKTFTYNLRPFWAQFPKQVLKNVITATVWKHQHYLENKIHFHILKNGLLTVMHSYLEIWNNI